MGITVVVALIDRPKEFCLGIALGKFVEVAIQLGTLTPGRLDRDHRGILLDKLTKSIGQTGFTGTGNTLQDDDTGSAKGGDEVAYHIQVIVQVQLGGCIFAELLTEPLQGNFIVVFRSHILGLIVVIHAGQAEETTLRRIHTGRFEGVAVRYRQDFLLGFFHCLLSLFLSLGFFCQGFQIRIPHLHGKDLVLLIIGPKQIPLQGTVFLGHPLILLPGNTAEEDFADQLTHEPDDQAAQTYQHDVGDQQHNPVIGIEAAAVALDDVHAHGEIEQVIQKIEDGTDGAPKGLKDLSDILSKIAIEITHISHLMVTEGDQICAASSVFFSA